MIAEAAASAAAPVKAAVLYSLIQYPEIALGLENQCLAGFQVLGLILMEALLLEPTCVLATVTDLWHWPACRACSYGHVLAQAPKAGATRTAWVS